MKTNTSAAVSLCKNGNDFRMLGFFLKNVLESFLGAESVDFEKLKFTVPPLPEMGDFALGCFQYAKPLGKTPAEAAKAIEEIANNLLVNWKNERNFVAEKFCAVGPYLNIYLNRKKITLQTIQEIFDEENNYGTNSSLFGKTMMVEYLSPNTNKPLHMGHMRNGVIGTTIARLLEANGAKVSAANNINDRGIHIAKSMMAYKLWGNGQTPESTGEKGDHFVGRYYVLYNQEETRLKKTWFAINGISPDATEKEKEEAEHRFEKECPLVQDCYQMLSQWEAQEPSVIELWKKMNQWVYDGFAKTNERLGFFFNKVYYESNTYKLGKQTVLDNVAKGIGQKTEKGIEIDLTDVKLGQKPIMLLRADGTSVYMTQDIGLAETRFAETNFDKVIYVVGSEQEFHFKCLFEILKRFGFAWHSKLHHLSYGMVILPSGKMKSREGTVVDADDLVDSLRSSSGALIKAGASADEVSEGSEKIAIGALKYMLASASPGNSVLFDPQKSLSFEGNTGPYLQYACVRIAAIEEKALKCKKQKWINEEISDKEFEIVKKIILYPDAVKRAAEESDTSILTDCLYGIAKSFSAFYADYYIIHDDCADVHKLNLCRAVKQVLENGLQLLGIPIPEKM